MIVNINEFKYACKEFLSGFPINALRSYGREIGVDKPTKDKKKNVLIEEIVLVLSGEVAPQPPSKLGAPVKNDFVDPKLKDGIARICAQYTIKQDTTFIDRMREIKENPYTFVVADPDAEKLSVLATTEIYEGQLETISGVSVLIPLDCMDDEAKVILTEEMVKAHNLRTGDVIRCYAERHQNAVVAIKVLSVNGIKNLPSERAQFELNQVIYPFEKINFMEEDSTNTLLAKILQWMVVVGKGQRGLLVAPPKSGKSRMLLDIANIVKRVDKSVVVLSLLTGQSPEEVTYYRNSVGYEGFVYSTYEDTPERQMFVAEFILKRAKRYAESGKHVLLLVDSLNALARAFNDTDASAGGKLLAGGLEGKTVQYLKRYFGTARCLVSNGSLTILGALSVDTGNPADDILKAELTAISNLEIVLSEDLARRRVYPAIDILKSMGKGTSHVSGFRDDIINEILRSDYLFHFDIESLHQLLVDSNTFEEVEEKAMASLRKTGTKKKTEK